MEINSIYNTQQLTMCPVYKEENTSGHAVIGK